MRLGDVSTRSVRSVRWSLLALALAAAVAGCTGGTSNDGEASSVGSQRDQVYVQPDFDAPMVVVNVRITDDGFEPSTIFLPAGQKIRLILRSYDADEHHFRVAGLIPAHMSWYLPAEFSDMELESMTAEQRAAAGIDETAHHLGASMVPFRDESPGGIDPLPNEVHGYLTAGSLDVMEFFATNVGGFVSQDVAYPDITGRVVVFDPNA